MKNLQSNTTIREFLHAVASPDEAHGAVSVAAVSAGLGTSIFLLVATLPQTRADSVDARTRLAEAAAGLSNVQEQLLETVETETAVKIFAARNMPQGSPPQRAERQAAIQFALRASAEVPLEVMRLCAGALKHAPTVVAHASRAASTDIQLGMGLLQTAFEGARSNLEAKLSNLIDAQYITSVVDEMARLNEEVVAVVRATDGLLQVPPA
jgi:glutamate formiminotransferase/formiminotetrahydrofolate cyclodeaminase